MSPTTTNTSASAGHTSSTSTKTEHTEPPAYTPSDASSLKSTSSTTKKHLLEVFTRKLNHSGSPTSTTQAPKRKDGLTNEERKIRNEARASYYSTLG
ncbi:hypothetical protein M3J09_011555 [Ascochyta lentis]